MGCGFVSARTGYRWDVVSGGRAQAMGARTRRDRAALTTSWTHRACCVGWRGVGGDRGPGEVVGVMRRSRTEGGGGGFVRTAAPSSGRPKRALKLWDGGLQACGLQLWMIVVLSESGPPTARRSASRAVVYRRQVKM